MPLDGIQQKALFERLEGERNKSRPRPHWIDNTNENITRTYTKGYNGLDK